jgi:hypothetical protein
MVKRDNTKFRLKHCFPYYLPYFFPALSAAILIFGDGGTGHLDCGVVFLFVFMCKNHLKTFVEAQACFPYSREAIPYTFMLAHLTFS